MSALICGSVAYDNIMVFEDSFKNHILPDKIHMLNVAFLVPKLRREFGWEPEISFEEGLRATAEWYATARDWWGPLKERAPVRETAWS